MPKRIAIISYHTCPLSAQEGKETGGMNVFVSETAKELVKLGYEIDIFTRDQGEKNEKVVLLETGIRVIHLSAGPQESIAKKDLSKFLPEFEDNFIGFVSKNKIQYKIFDCHYFLSGLAALKIREKMKQYIPISITLHTLALMKNLVAKTDDEKEDKFRIHSEMKLVQEADRIVSTGHADAQYLEYLYSAPRNKIAVISPGVDSSIFKPLNKKTAKTKVGSSPENTIVLFVGRIEPLKGIDVLLYAMKILLEKKLKCRLCLWIVGGDTSQDLEYWPEELKKLESLRKLLSISAEVKFVGRKHPEELPYYYNASEVVVMPSQYESFGMTALEAMSCEVPVITTNATGVSDFLDKEHLEHQKLITSANNPLLLAEQIEYLITHEKERVNLGRDLRNHIKDMSWKKTAKKYSKIYNELF